MALWVNSSDLMPPRKSWGRNAFICDAVGSHLIEGQLRRLGAKLHIFGHTHINSIVEYDGVRYMQNALGYGIAPGQKLTVVHDKGLFREYLA